MVRGECVILVDGRLRGHDGVVLGSKRVDGRVVVLVRVHVYAWLAESDVRELQPGETLGGGVWSDGRTLAEWEAGVDRGVAVEPATEPVGAVKRLRSGRGSSVPWQRAGRGVKVIG